MFAKIVSTVIVVAVFLGAILYAYSTFKMLPPSDSNQVFYGMIILIIYSSIGTGALIHFLLNLIWQDKIPKSKE